MPVPLQSSISEGLPISILEAALCGLCVVCTNVGGCAELLAAPPGEQLHSLPGWCLCRHLSVQPAAPTDLIQATGTS